MKNVTLITIDCLRWDFLKRDKAHSLKNLGGIFNAGYVFSNIRTAGPNTPSSFASLLTSSYPLMYGGYLYLAPQRLTLAEVLRQGLEKSLELGADIIVNTDADNQYKGEDIPRLIKPILEKKVDIVVGCRDIANIKHFSLTKKILQKAGSFIVRRFSKTNIPDTTSGFRAYSRDAAMRLNIFSDYTYTLESIIQAGRYNMHIAEVSITTNPKLRSSRLIRSTLGYIMHSMATVLRIYLMYEPLKSFFILGILPIMGGAAFIVRFLVDHFTRPSGGHIQSLIMAAVAIIIGFVTMMIGLLGDIISRNRKLEEEILYRLKKQQYR